MDNEQIEKRNKLAEEVLQLARNTLLVNLRFLDAALNEMNPVAVDDFTLATDGDVLAYQPTYVLKRYKEEREEIVRAYLHMLFHGVFRHMFVHTLVDQDLWGLACDIAVEYVISGLRLKAVTTHRELLQKSHYTDLEKKAGKLTAEKLYRYFLDNPPDKRTLTELRAAFYADDHRIWFMSEAEKALLLGKTVSITITEEAADGSGQGSGGENGNENSEGGPLADAAMSVSALEERWTDISNRIQMDMETFSREKEDAAGGLVQNLREANRERYDYAKFLKKFAVRGEVVKINDDEFDYIYYTYGLKLYKKMPLVEPLEYKEVKRIREFVIAIDTSGSVSGRLVQLFVQKTYNILKSTESFFSKINLHIIQCDAQIQQDTKITTQQEFDRFMETMEIHGLGGTDFRPVFQHVDRLRDAHEFENRKGLIYLTDGFGT